MYTLNKGNIARKALLKEQARFKPGNIHLSSKDLLHIFMLAILPSKWMYLLYMPSLVHWMV